QQAQQRAGVDAPLGTDLCFGISFHLAPTKEQAIAEATPFYQEHAKLFAPLGFMGPMEDEQLNALGRRGGYDDSGLASLEFSCERGAWYCGPPEGFVEFLQERAEKYPGLEAVNVQSSMGTPLEVMLEQLQWFASDVMPKVQGK
ncbi:MAG: hypothetical protein HN394_17610, partial [Rhodospirillaceae bacterium]|nr:hypothetical protein [Rhodospirillaceae bacterium]